MGGTRLGQVITKVIGILSSLLLVTKVSNQRTLPSTKPQNSLLAYFVSYGVEVSLQLLLFKTSTRPWTAVSILHVELDQELWTRGVFEHFKGFCQRLIKCYVKMANEVNTLLPAMIL